VVSFNVKKGFGFLRPDDQVFSSLLSLCFSFSPLCFLFFPLFPSFFPFS